MDGLKWLPRASDIKRLARPFDQVSVIQMTLVDRGPISTRGTGVKKLIIEVSWAPREYLLTIFKRARQLIS